MKKVKPASAYDRVLGLEYSKADTRRITLLESTLDLISHHGIDRVSLQTVGKRAKMLRSHVAYYFPNKDALVEAAIQYAVHVAQEITARHVMAAPEKSRLSAYVSGNFAWLTEHPRHASVMLLLGHLSTSQPKYRRLFDEVARIGEERVYLILKGMLALEETQLRSLSRRIRMVVIGGITALSTSGDPVHAKILEEDAWSTIQKLVEASSQH